MDCSQARLLDQPVREPLSVLQTKPSPVVWSLYSPRVQQVSSVVLTSAALTACKVDGVALSPISTPQAARFLQQAQFSSTMSEIDQVKSVGFEAWLDAQFALPVNTTVSGWEWMKAQGYAVDAMKFDPRPVDHMMWHQLITCKDTLRKRVALALSEILVVSADGLNGEYLAFAVAGYWDLLNQHAFGNYNDLIRALTLNPAMGRFLNTKGNKKENEKTGRRPDENYARELLQLFTIGLYQLNQDGSVKKNTQGKPIETFNLDQIVQLARVFTGWDEDSSTTAVGSPEFTRIPMSLDPKQHSTLSSTVFGYTIPAGTAATTALSSAINVILQHANVAPFVSKQLIQRLVTSNPSPAYIARVARVFANNGRGVRGDLKSVVRAILLDAEARIDPSSTNTSGGKVREPMLRLVHWCRTFGASSVSGQWLVGNLGSSQWHLSQSPLRSPSVFNFFRPSYSPSNSMLASQGKVAPELQICDESSVAAYINFMQQVIEKGVPRYDDWRIAELTVSYAQELTLIEQPSALVERLNILLCAGQLSASSRTLIEGAIVSIKNTLTDWQINRVYCAVLLVMASPDYQVQK